jgi:hypothetical protein
VNGDDGGLGSVAADCSGVCFGHRDRVPSNESGGAGVYNRYPQPVLREDVLDFGTLDGVAGDVEGRLPRCAQHEPGDGPSPPRSPPSRAGRRCGAARCSPTPGARIRSERLRSRRNGASLRPLAGRRAAELCAAFLLRLSRSGPGGCASRRPRPRVRGRGRGVGPGGCGDR